DRTHARAHYVVARVVIGVPLDLQGDVSIRDRGLDGNHGRRPPIPDKIAASPPAPGEGAGVGPAGGKPSGRGAIALPPAGGGSAGPAPIGPPRGGPPASPSAGWGTSGGFSSKVIHSRESPTRTRAAAHLASLFHLQFIFMQSTSTFLAAISIFLSHDAFFCLIAPPNLIVDVRGYIFRFQDLH